MAGRRSHCKSETQAVSYQLSALSYFRITPAKDQGKCGAPQIIPTVIPAAGLSQPGDTDPFAHFELPCQGSIFDDATDDLMPRYDPFRAAFEFTLAHMQVRPADAANRDPTRISSGAGLGTSTDKRRNGWLPTLSAVSSTCALIFLPSFFTGIKQRLSPTDL